MTAKAKPATVYRLDLVPAAGWSTDGTYRLKRALKCLLRSFGLRCISAVELPPETRPELPAGIPAADDGREGLDGK